MRSLEDRLVNWGEAWRSRMRAGRDLVQRGVWSTRRGYGNAWHWDAAVGVSSTGAHIASAPSAPVGVDLADASAVELAVGAVEIFHHVILKGHYVRCWDPDRTLRVARQASGLGNPRKGGDYEASVRMGRRSRVTVLRRRRSTYPWPVRSATRC